MDKVTVDALREIDINLYHRYPDLLCQYTWPPTQSCLMWGIVPGTGWATVVRNMVAELDAYRVQEGIKLELSQSKEKFGELRVYYDTSASEQQILAIDDIIANYSAISAGTCIYCGQPGTLREGGWIHPSCDSCEEKLNQCNSAR